MRRRVPLKIWAVACAASAALVITPSPGAGEVLSRGVSVQVFHLTAYDEHSRPLRQGQGLVMDPRGLAIVSASTLEGAATAVAVMMDGSEVPVTEVIAQDNVSGLIKVRLAREVPGFSGETLENGRPQVGERVIFSTLTKHSGQACLACVITTVRDVPDLHDLYYVETSQYLPQPGGAVFSSDGRMIGIVLLRSGDLHAGIMASRGRFSPLAGQRGTGIALDEWSAHRSSTWKNMAYARYLMGQVALWQGQPQVTLEHIEDHVRSVSEIRSSMTALLGETYLAMDLLPESINAFKAVLEMGSPPGRVYCKLAWAYMEAGQFSLAEDMCRQAILADPESSTGYTLLSHLQNMQGNHRQAIYEARRALNRKTDCPCANFERGRGYIGLARYRSAIESLVKATDIDPTYSEAFNSLGYALLRHGDPLGSIKSLEEAVRLEPEMAQAWDNLGEAYSMAGLPEKAVHALRLAVCLDPSRTSGYCRLARELIRQGSYLDAVDIIQEGLDRCDGSQWLIYYLGKALLYEGRGDLARVQAQRLFKENRKLAGQLIRIIDAGPQG